MTNTTPMSLAQNLCNHSQKKMNLKSDKVKSVFNNWYWGVALYLSNSANHFCALNGGNVPVTTFHSVIERPEPVSRVIPPRITWMINITIPMYIQIATARLPREDFMRRKGRVAAAALIH